MPEMISNPPVVAALVSASVTILLFLIKGLCTPFWNKHFHVYKIKVEHNYEQRKKIKEAISKYKMPLLDSAESLNHRLWNFSGNCAKGWHNFKNNELLSEKYYLQNFCYRFLAFYAWCLKFERELIYLDVTLSDKDDLYFVKYMKVMKNIFCDASMLNDTGYNNEHAVDHFFKDDLTSMVEGMFTSTGVITFSEFKLKNKVDYAQVCKYISTIMQDKSCNKWHLINCFHFILMAFLSKYGYDYQRTGLFKLYKLRCREPQNKLIVNFNLLICNAKLNKCKEIKKAIAILECKSLVAQICNTLKLIK
ncbi:hypothetical protein ACLMPK_18385 [Yersinia enterocolitica]|jgi:hypothetical protein|uniref:hypothetical protein n=1 Tax=Yersinia enterocolitica TaxID=630 RepID=UPI00398CBBAD